MSLTTELIKEAMRGANNLSNESPLANQFMNVLSQQQAQKARENQMMQQFLMERRMKEEDFNRKVEFAKMFQTDNQKDDLKKMEKMQSAFEKIEDKKKLDRMSRGLGLMQTVVDLTEDPQIVNMLEKLKSSLPLQTKLDEVIKKYVHGMKGKDPKNSLDKMFSDVEQTILSHAKNIGIVNWDKNDTEAFSLFINAIKGGTIGYIDAIGGNQSKATIDTLLNSKALSLMHGAQSAHNFYTKLYSTEAKHVEHLYEQAKKPLLTTYGDAFEKYAEDAGWNEKYKFNEYYAEPKIVAMTMDEFKEKIASPAKEFQLSEQDIQNIINDIDDGIMPPKELYKKVIEEIPMYKKTHEIEPENEIDTFLKQAMSQR